jgi:hypothetical protein
VSPGRGGGGCVLVLRALGLGDAFTGVAALRGVRRAWPDHRLVLAAPAPVGRLLLELGVVDERLDAGPLEPVPWPSPEPPQVAVNLHGRGPQSHRLLTALRPDRLVAFACPGAGHEDGPGWRADEHEVDRWCRLVRWAGGGCGREDLSLPPPGPRGDLVVVHPGAASGSRRWPPERWADVVAALRGDGLRVAVTGTEQEAELCAEVAAAGAHDLAGTLALPDLVRTVAAARLLLCGDTGVAHLATAYGTPSVLLFGPTPPQAWGPAVEEERHVVLWHGRDGEPPGDPHGDEVDPRLDRIEVGQVLAAAGRLLGA